MLATFDDFAFMFVNAELVLLQLVAAAAAAGRRD